MTNSETAFLKDFASFLEKRKTMGFLPEDGAAFDAITPGSPRGTNLETQLGKLETRINPFSH